MASRSFKPASYLASAAAHSPSSPRQRPTFTRSSSGTSVKSTKSEDSIVATLKGLVMESKHQEKEDDLSAAGTSAPRSIDDTPGRKRSQPIAIELPSRQKVYTPLSARGDLPGGYFPNHESPTTDTVRRPHPFYSKPSQPDSPDMSTASSLAASPSELQKHPGMLLGPLSPTLPESLLRPMGKYHPSNYKSPETLRISTPVPTNLSIPTSLQEKKRRDKERKRGPTTTGHARQNSEVQIKIQEYQRNMIASAQMAAKTSLNASSRGMSQGEKPRPVSPRLLPAGSPGPITPLELEVEADEGEGYLVAGQRHRGQSLIGGGIERERENLGGEAR